MRLRRIRRTCHCEEAPQGRRGNPFPFLEARPPAAGFFVCKEPREETTRASALDPGLGGGAVQAAGKTCRRSGLGSVWHLRRIGLPPLRHITRPDLKIVAVQWVPEKPHVLPCPVQRLALVGAIHESPVRHQPPYPPKLQRRCLYSAYQILFLRSFGRLRAPAVGGALFLDIISDKSGPFNCFLQSFDEKTRGLHTRGLDKQICRP